MREGTTVSLGCVPSSCQNKRIATSSRDVGIMRIQDPTATGNHLTDSPGAGVGGVVGGGVGDGVAVTMPNNELECKPVAATANTSARD